MASTTGQPAQGGSQAPLQSGYTSNDEYTIKSDVLRNSRFEILYMPARARAEVPRLILEYVGADYKSIEPVNWAEEKKGTPFGLLPILTHYKPDGKSVRVAEGPALTRYIARLFNLSGNNLEEEAFLDSCYQCAFDNVFSTLLIHMWLKPNPKDKATIDAAFAKLAPFFDCFERLLVQNGSNGYLLHDKTTYAEFPWFEWVDFFYSDFHEQAPMIASESVRPTTYRLFKRLRSNPRIQAYINGGRWKYRPA